MGCENQALPAISQSAFTQQASWNMSIIHVVALVAFRRQEAGVVSALMAFAMSCQFLVRSFCIPWSEFFLQKPGEASKGRFGNAVTCVWMTMFAASSGLLFASK